MNALVDANNLESLSTDGCTYLADTTGDLAFSGANFSIDGSVRNDTISDTIGGCFPQPLTWDLETLGILK